MTNVLETLKRPPENKKRITITLSEETYHLLELELEHAKKINPTWNRSKLIDTILNYELKNVFKTDVKMLNSTYTNESNKFDT